jgi:uncharacterized protein HemX
MRGSRLSTLMLLIVIAAMGTALAAQEQRHRQREAELVTRYEAELTARLERQTRQEINMLHEREKSLKEREAELSRECDRLGINQFRCRLE